MAVKLYSAVEDRTVHFHVLEKTSMARIKQHIVNPETNAEVPREQVRKGYEVERGVYVLLTDEDMRKGAAPGIPRHRNHPFRSGSSNRSAMVRPPLLSRPGRRKLTHRTLPWRRPWSAKSAKASPVGSCEKSSMWVRCVPRVDT